MRRRTWLSALLLLLLALFVTGVAFAQDGTPRQPTEDEVNAIAKQMYCPVCENTPLDVCPTQACAEWRELIRDKLILYLLILQRAKKLIAYKYLMILL